MRLPSTAIRVVAAIVLLAGASRAEAFPAFARKQGLSCTACHVGWPIFNQLGQSFRDNGYQFNLGKDDPVTIAPSHLPIALRTTPSYQYVRATHQPSDAGPITTASGGTAFPGVDILTGGTIKQDVSFLLVVAGFSPEDGLATVESAWARLDNLGGSGWANLKVGKFELDQPASAHRAVTLTYGYAAYAAHSVGSRVAFDMGENQLGVELDGHSARSTTRYALSVTSANGAEGQSKNGWSAPVVYGHVQQAFELPVRLVPWVRVGALGSVGWWPTAFETSGGEPIPGTARAHKRFYRAGAELSWIFGNPSTPMFFTAAYLLGRDGAGLAEGTDPAGEDLATRKGRFQGGFAELDWVPFSRSSYDATPLLLFARYDGVRYRRGPGDVNGATVGARHYFALGPRASAAIHLEYHWDRVKGGAWLADDTLDPALDVVTQVAMAGVDFDF